MSQAFLDGREDVYGGVTVKTETFAKLSDADFSSALNNSLDKWKDEKKRGIWFHVELHNSRFIPLLASAGFRFHHAQPACAVMTRWLPEGPSTLPKYAHTQIGVGGLVVDASGRVLLMREKKGIYLGWKFPGGVSEPDESIFDTAAREVFEETGVKTEAQAVLCFRQMARSQFRGVGDIYFMCVMRPRNEADLEIRACAHETADARWMTRDEVSELPEDEFHEFHHKILARYDAWIASGRRGCYKESDFAPLRGIDVHMFYVD